MLCAISFSWYGFLTDRSGVQIRPSSWTSCSRRLGPKTRRFPRRLRTPRYSRNNLHLKLLSLCRLLLHIHLSRSMRRLVLQGVLLARHPWEASRSLAAHMRARTLIENEPIRTASKPIKITRTLTIIGLSRHNGAAAVVEETGWGGMAVH